MKNKFVDVVVAGGGMAGLVAALTALESGKTVTILEKGSRYGGSMALSNGLVWTFSSLEEARKHIPEGNVALQELLIQNLPSDMEWLKSYGVEFEPEISYLGYGVGARMAPGQLLDVVMSHLDKFGVHRETGVGVQDLLISEGRVEGVTAYDSQGYSEIAADRVVLATGGFQGNADLVARYISPYANEMYLRSNPWSTGDGLLAAVAVGGALTPMLDAFYGHAVNAPPARFDPFHFQEMSHKYGQLAVALNLSGKRFVDESLGTGEEWLNKHIAQQQSATAIYVFDANVAQTKYEGGALAQVVTDRAIKAGAPVIQAADLQSLVNGMEAWGVPSLQALKTLEQYNAAVGDPAHQATLDPARRRYAYPVAKAPYTAIMVRAALTFTCGGLSVDMDMQVLRRAASVSTLPLVTAQASELFATPIQGLYAAGSDVGGFSGNGYMGGLSQAIVTGRIAGSCS